MFDNLQPLTSSDLSAYISNFSGVISNYSSLFLENGIDGEALFECKNEMELKRFLGLLSIENKIHQNLFCLSLQNLNSSLSSPSSPETSPTDSISTNSSTSTTSTSSISQNSKGSSLPSLNPPLPNPPLRQISWSELSLPQPATKQSIVLGTGGFSSVLKVQRGHGLVAVKIFKFPDRKLVQKEAQLLQHLNDFFVRFIGVCEGVIPEDVRAQLAQIQLPIPANSHQIGLVMHFESGGSLEDVLFSTSLASPLSLQERCRLLSKVSEALMVLHSEGMVHGDLKPPNVLLSAHQEVRLSDFGLSKLYQSATYSESIRLTATQRGTPCYMAPEIFVPDTSGKVADVSRKGDVYAMSIMSWEVLAGEKAFSKISAHRVHVHVEDGGRPDLEKLSQASFFGVSSLPQLPAIQDLLSRGWSADRSVRPSISEFYTLFNSIYDQIREGQFDLFMSHVWTEKPFLCQIYKILQLAGFRVWYDQNEMGLDTRQAMRQGVERSTIFLLCLSKQYQQRPNCLFELRTALEMGKPIFLLFVDPDIGDPLSWLSEEVRGYLGDKYLAFQLWFNVGGDLARLSQWSELVGESEDDYLVKGLEDQLSEKMTEDRGVIYRLLEMKANPPPLSPVTLPPIPLSPPGQAMPSFSSFTPPLTPLSPSTPSPPQMSSNDRDALLNDTTNRLLETVVKPGAGDSCEFSFDSAEAHVQKRILAALVAKKSAKTIVSDAERETKARAEAKESQRKYVNSEVCQYLLQQSAYVSFIPQAQADRFTSNCTFSLWKWAEKNSQRTVSSDWWHVNLNELFSIGLVSVSKHNRDAWHVYVFTEDCDVFSQHDYKFRFCSLSDESGGKIGESNLVYVHNPFGGSNFYPIHEATDMILLRSCQCLLDQAKKLGFSHLEILSVSTDMENSCGDCPSTLKRYSWGEPDQIRPTPASCLSKDVAPDFADSVFNMSQARVRGKILSHSFGFRIDVTAYLAALPALDKSLLSASPLQDFILSFLSSHRSLALDYEVKISFFPVEAYYKYIKQFVVSLWGFSFILGYLEHCESLLSTRLQPPLIDVLDCNIMAKDFISSCNFGKCSTDKSNLAKFFLDTASDVVDVYYPYFEDLDSFAFKVFNGTLPKYQDASQVLLTKLEKDYFEVVGSRVQLEIQQKYATAALYMAAARVRGNKPSSFQQSKRDEQFDVQLKHLLIGDSGVGKTSLLLRLVNHSFTPGFITTIGIDFKIKNEDLFGVRVKNQIWDTAGQERFRTITTSYFSGAMIIYILYDVTDRQTFSSVRNWISLVSMHATDTPIVIIGNKSESWESRAVMFDEGLQLAKEFGYLFFETSAKCDKNVAMAFNMSSAWLLLKLEDQLREGRNPFASTRLTAPPPPRRKKKYCSLM